MTPNPGRNQPNQQDRQPGNQPPRQGPPHQGGSGQQPPGQPQSGAQGGPPTGGQGRQQPAGQQGRGQGQPPVGQGSHQPPAGGMQGGQTQQPMGQQGTQQGPPRGTGQQGFQGQQSMGQQGSSWGQSTPQPTGPAQGMGGGPGVQTGGRMPGATRLGPATLSPITIEEIARTEVVTAERDDSIESIVDDMAENNVGSVVIVEDDRPVGIITDRTIALALRETPDVLERTVEDLMAEDLATASVDSDAFEVLDRMSDAGVRRIPLVDDDGELRGIVTLDDVLLYLEDNLHTVAETVREQFPDL